MKDFTSFVSCALSFLGNLIEQLIFLSKIYFSFEYFLRHLLIFLKLIKNILIVLFAYFLRKMGFLPCIEYRNRRPFYFFIIYQ
jgi:hypothetical protein